MGPDADAREGYWVTKGERVGAALRVYEPGGSVEPWADQPCCSHWSAGRCTCYLYRVADTSSRAPPSAEAELDEIVDDFAFRLAAKPPGGSDQPYA